MEYAGDVPPSLGISRGAPPSRWEGRRRRRRRRLCRRLRLSSSRCSAASCPLTPPLPFASCTPPLPFTSCLPAGCRVAPGVAPPPPRDFASTSSLPSGCHNLQGPTCRTAAASRPLAASALRCATSASRRAAASQLAVSSQSPMRRRRCRRCAGVFAVIAIVSVTLGDCHPRCSLSSWCCWHRSRRRRRQHPSPSSSSLCPVAPSPSSSTLSPVALCPSRHHNCRVHTYHKPTNERT